MAYRYRRRSRWQRRLRRWLRRNDHKMIVAAAACGLLLAAFVHAGGGAPATTTTAQATVAPASVSGNVALGERLAASGYGWTGGQWDCLYALWTRESGWSATAENPRSGAYGIAQALGHGPTNQYPAGPANPPTSSASAQVRWGLGYIADAYGTPCGAWAHEEADGWY
jgi:resuscitation-promoting factor RpfB